MDFTCEQRRAIACDGHLVVTAGAGSGKTRVLVERYLRLIETADAAGADPFTSVLAITFTKKAAREMRERVRLALEQRARTSAAHERTRWSDLFAAVERARIGTIHSFCASLLRAQPAETSLDPGFTVLDEAEAGLLLRESVDEALRETVHNYWSVNRSGESGSVTVGSAGDGLAAGIQVLLEEFGPNELRAMLIDLLRSGGETRAALRALPSTVANLQRFWNERLAALRAELLTELFTGDPWRQAAATVTALAPVAPPEDLIGAQVRAVADWLATLNEAEPDLTPLAALNLRGGSRRLWGDAERLQAAREALSALRDAYRTATEIVNFVPDPHIEERTALATLALRDLFWIADAYYTRRKAALDCLDFDDLERRTRELLERHPSVRARWRAELRAVLVDEFQDTNDDQRAIIYALVGLDSDERAAGPHLFVVGDAKQSIYRFRGADVSVFRAVEVDIRAWGGQCLSLRTSFRAHATLVELVNRLGERIFARGGTLRPYEVPYEPLEAHRPAPPHSCVAEFHIIGDSEADRCDAEAMLLARRIAELVEGAAGPIVYDPQTGWRVPTFDDIAILFQASTAFDSFETALRAMGIPYLTVAGRGYYGRQEVLDLIHLLQVLDDPSNELALVGVLRSPLCALDDGTIMALKLRGPTLWAALMAFADEEIQADSLELRFAARNLRDLYALRGRLSVIELLRAALDRTGYLAAISALTDGERRRVNVEKLLTAARLSGARGLRVFREYLEALLHEEVREGEAPLEAQGVVRLMTIHQSKGLEFPIVALPDLGRTPPSLGVRWLARRAWGLALRVRDPTGQDRLSIAFLLAHHTERRLERAERDRLLYVALTRARDYLLLSGPARSSSNASWQAILAAALGHPWERGGPPAGPLGPILIVRY